jgi:hypothetical protein
MNIKIGLFWHVMPYSLVYIEACLLKITIVKPAETAVARQRLCKKPIAKQQFCKHKTIPEPSLSNLPMQQ